LKQITSEKKRPIDSARGSHPDINIKERELLSTLRHDIQHISKEYDITVEELIPILSEKKLMIPVSAFLAASCPLESAVRYLREIENLSFNQIADLLKRDYTTVWRTYQNSKGKSPNETHSPDEHKICREHSISKHQLQIPVDILTNQRLSILESIVLFLKNHFGLRLHEIAVLLNRNDRTIWTVLHRAEVKQA